MLTMEQAKQIDALLISFISYLPPDFKKMNKKEKDKIVKDFTLWNKGLGKKSGGELPS